MLKLFISSVEEAVGFVKESNPCFSFLSEDYLDTSLATSSAPSNDQRSGTQSIPTDSPQFSSFSPTTSTSARSTPQSRHPRTPHLSGEIGPSTSTDSVPTDILADSSIPPIRKRPLDSSHTRPAKHARKTRSTETCGKSWQKKTRSCSTTKKKRAVKQQLDYCETDDDDPALIDILAQGPDFPCSKLCYHSQSLSETDESLSGGEVNGRHSDSGIDDLPSSSAVLPTSTPVIAQKTSPIAPPKDTNVHLTTSVADTSNTSNRSTPSSVLPPLSSPATSSEDDDELPTFNTSAKDNEKTFVRELGKSGLTKQITGRCLLCLLLCHTIQCISSFLLNHNLKGSIVSR